MGSFGAHGLTPGAIKDVVAEIRSLTTKPFAMNLWVSMEDEGAFTSGEEAFARSLSAISGHIEGLGGTLPVYTPYAPIRFEDQVRVILDAKVPAFSFIYGIPPVEILDECRKQGIVIIGTATTPDEAVALAGCRRRCRRGLRVRGGRTPRLVPAVVRRIADRGPSPWSRKSPTWLTCRSWRRAA